MAAVLAAVFVAALLGGTGLGPAVSLARLAVSLWTTLAVAAVAPVAAVGPVVVPVAVAVPISLETPNSEEEEEATTETTTRPRPPARRIPKISRKISQSPATCREKAGNRQSQKICDDELRVLGCEGRCLNVNHLIKYESVSNYRFALPVRRGGRA